MVERDTADYEKSEKMAITSGKESLKRQGKEIPTEGPGLQVFRNGILYFK